MFSYLYVCSNIWICLQCDSSVFGLAELKGLSPSLQSDDVAQPVTHYLDNRCFFVNDSWTVGACVTWLTFKSTSLWHYFSTFFPLKWALLLLFFVLFFQRITPSPLPLVMNQPIRSWSSTRLDVSCCQFIRRNESRMWGKSGRWVKEEITRIHYTGEPQCSRVFLKCSISQTKKGNEMKCQ